MFWGDGDSSKLTPEEKRTLADLRRLVETRHLRALTPEQAEVAVQAIKFYAAISATGGIIAGFRNVCIFVGSMVLMWWSFRDWFVAMIKSITAGV